jgi:hypothetical protein
MMKTYTQEEIHQMVTEVEGQVESLVKSEVASLQKWENEKSSSSSSSSSASASASRATEAQKKEASASSSRSTEAQKAEVAGTPQTVDAAQGGLKKGADDPAGDAGSSDALPSEGASDGASPPASAAPSADAAPAADPAAAAPGAEQAPTLPELTEAYSQLSPPELDMHEQALHAAKAQMSAGAAPAGAPAAPAASPSAAPAPDALAAPAPMPGAASAPVAPEFGKSEADVKIASLEKSLEATTQILVTLLGKPNFKSVTGEDAVTKTEKSFEGLTKSEVTERLNKAVRKGLSTGDSLLLKSFYKGEASVNDIGHLLAGK